MEAGKMEAGKMEAPNRRRQIDGRPNRGPDEKLKIDKQTKIKDTGNLTQIIVPHTPGGLGVRDNNLG